MCGGGKKIGKKSHEKLFLLLISFDNSLSGAIVGLFIGSAICSSSPLVFASLLCCHDHYAACNNGELFGPLLTLTSQVGKKRKKKRNRPIIWSSLVSGNEQRAAVEAALSLTPWFLSTRFKQETFIIHTLTHTHTHKKKKSLVSSCLLKDVLLTLKSPESTPPLLWQSPPLLTAAPFAARWMNLPFHSGPGSTIFFFNHAKSKTHDNDEQPNITIFFFLTVQQTSMNIVVIIGVFFFFFFPLQSSQINQIPTKYSQAESTKFLILTVVSILCIVAVLLASTVVYCFRHRSHQKIKEKLTNLGTDTGSDATATYQELCRQRMAVKPPTERPEPISSRINSVSSQFSDGGQAVSPSARSSISSWSEEPAHSNMDISTGHMILSYMEDHLKNKDRLEKEWEALCAYQAEPNASTVGLKDGNAKKNRSTAVVAYDHSRITLKVENSQGNSDYINASPIMDHDPRNPAYIATQGPLPSTVADFWQMVWENGCVVIVMLTPLVESGVKQCYHYWPDEGSNLYHIYEVNLVSEHIWCDDFLVRSFYLKNMQTNETRTVTQFHFLTWLNQNVPETSRTLLDFRRKVNKCYRGRSCPIIVHCSDGSGRSGTYILIDMVLNKMAKGAKEIDIAATLEHLRDQRPGMVQTKDQFEFALTAVAEEVNAILKALPQ
uniref:Protein tyrosine phosphatase receptor type N2 n=1 Tax=Salarias fasciatus TaxID=181472 RepID=A0A672F6S8_SALFA